MKYTLILFFIGLSQLSFSQGWYKTFGGNGFDYGYDIVEMPDSGFLITGMSGSFSSGHSDAFLLKINKWGDYEWSRSYGGAENDGAFVIKRVENFGVYLMGRTTSQDGDFDAWVTLLSDAGDEIWSKSYEGQNWEEIIEAAVTRDSGLIVGVNSFGSNSIDEDAILMRLNSDGDTIWSQTTSFPGTDEITNIEAYQDSMFVISSNHLDSSTNTYFGCLRLMHENGNEVWKDTVDIDPAGSLFLTDFYIENDTLFAVGSYRENDSLLFDLMRYIHYMPLNSAGEVLLSYGNSFRNIEGDIVVPAMSTPNKYVVYRVRNPSGGTLELNDNFVVAQANNSLGITNVIGQPATEGEDLLSNGSATADSGAVFVGYQALENGSTAIAVVKIGPNYGYPASFDSISAGQLVGLDESEFNIHASIKPNPTNEAFVISIDEGMVDSYSVIALSGKVIFSGSISSAETLVSAASLNSGVYLVNLYNKSSLVGVTRIVKK